MGIDDDNTPAYGDSIREYSAPGVVVTWEKERCEHAAECVRGLPLVFRPERRPWIDAHHATVDDLVETIDRCPSYALGYRTDDGRARAFPAP
ncbi:(4Fe-4S)-binding protein [Nocardioides sp. WG-D5]